MVTYLIIPKQELFHPIELWALIATPLVHEKFLYWFALLLFLIPYNNTELLFDSQSMHKCILEQNMKNLSKTEGTPFTSEPLTSQ